MCKRRTFIIVAGIVALGAILVTFLNRRYEPVYSGRVLSQWLAIYQSHVFDDELAPETTKAENAVRAIGTNCLPFLLRWIRYEPPAWRKKLRRSLPDRFADSPPIARFVDGERAARANVCINGFGILGTNAVAAIPELIAIMNDTKAPRSSGRAMLALSNLGMSGFDALVSALSDQQRLNRPSIIYGLRLAAYRIGTNTCLPPLVKALSDQDHFVRRAATNVLQALRQKC